MKINRSTIITIVLIAWGVLSTVYIGWSSWQQFKNGKIVAALNEGAIKGYQQAVLEVASAAEKCQAVPLNIGTDADGNQKTVEIVSVKCLQDAAAGNNVQDAKNTEKK